MLCRHCAIDCAGFCGRLKTQHNRWRNLQSERQSLVKWHWGSPRRGVAGTGGGGGGEWKTPSSLVLPLPPHFPAIPLFPRCPALPGGWTVSGRKRQSVCRLTRGKLSFRNRCFQLLARFPTSRDPLTQYRVDGGPAS